MDPTLVSSRTQTQQKEHLNKSAINKSSSYRKASLTGAELMIRHQEIMSGLDTTIERNAAAIEQNRQLLQRQVVTSPD